MNEKEELSQKLKQELHWVKYRYKMLNSSESRKMEDGKILE